MEAFYRFFLSLYLKEKQSHMAMPDISDLLKKLVSEFSSLTSDTELDTFRDLVDETISTSILSLEDFKSFMDNLCEKQDTIRFWYQFISVDIMAYIGLYIQSVTGIYSLETLA